MQTSAPVLIDSHAHLDLDTFDADRATVLERARSAGIAACVVPATTRDGWDTLEQLCKRHDMLHAAYGLHPMFLHSHAPGHLQELEHVLERGRAVAVGECGLDFHVDGLDADTQRMYFKRQLEMAAAADLPVIIHARRAEEEVMQTVRHIKSLRGVVHSFSGSAEQARQLFQCGFLIGLGGPVTHDGSHRLHRLAARIPLEQLLLETDAPDQSGAAHQGERNEPGYLPEVLDRITSLRSESREEIAAAATRNARNLFGLH